ncbi:A24 family peptidase [Chelatococcus composti]|jgi:prepilin peptidase CpaA|uniref:Prepilin peptidase CpaA n=1 Tax=Chelatococcus composti TaxID=1743235 RepID=A0A841K703_9HYPH|nr:prepilin peptidase [Chelatococcus composti]MBB6167232.1 prepilin peptidase CpaA [Chelatococcus composti]MBS7735441.1 prepilin peptidase [Chelatococcus composti]GGG30333.1 type 4 prepilin peptidase 1 [Chelatococcus composti]
MTDVAILTLFPALMAFAAASDIATMTISNRVSLALVAGFFVVALAAGLPLSVIGWHVAAAALVLAIGFGLFAAGWIGGGDAKLAAATALWFGFGHLMAYLVSASLLGGLLTLVVLGLRKVPLPAFALGWGWAQRLHAANRGIPYGVALAGAALLIYPQTDIWRAALLAH